MSLLRCLAVMVACALTRMAYAAVDVVTVNLDPLIEQSAAYPTRFAVDIPHNVSSTRSGSWAVAANGIATWHYTVRIPTAVSLSFHAAVALPPHASLLVRDIRGMHVYHPSDIHHQELWSRISLGDALEFVLSVPTSERRLTSFRIQSLQAGYRGFGHHANHAHYDAVVHQQNLATGMAVTPSCVQNYVCDATSSNTAAGQATVAITIGNVGQCSATLVNDVPGDGTPYLLTARHCENGKYGGGNPGAASAINVYWDATSACGSVLDSIYDSATPFTVGGEYRSRATGRVARVARRDSTRRGCLLRRI
jgi:lysyl endopeptidase